MKNKTYKMILAAIFAALTAVSAFIKIPLPPVPFTMQIFIVILSALLLGSKLAFVSQIVYIAIGLIGVPIFSSGGGINYIFNPTFGYLLGFAVMALVVGAITERISEPSIIKYFFASFAGIIICYIFGVGYMYIIFKYVNHVSVSASSIIIKGFLLFLPWDILKIIIASWLGKEISRRFNVIKAQSA